MINEIIKNSNERMNICIQTFKSCIQSIRTGRASTELLSSICIEYFGKKTPLRKVANVLVEDARTLKINAFDESSIPAIKKAILNSNLDLNPVLYGKDIRIPLPSLTEERRKKLIKIVKNDAENSRILIRNIRRDFNDKFKSNVKNKIISKDQQHILQIEIQNMTDKFIKEIDSILSKKEKDLMQL